MPEEEFETIEFKEKLEEATEHAVEAAEHRSRWLVYLSFTTALIAVLAAVAALESGTYSNEALIQKNEALLAQAKASDQWAYYQAKGIKGSVYATQAAAARATNPELADKSQKEADRYTAEQEEISKSAREFEGEEKKDSELSDKSLEHHHRFANRNDHRPPPADRAAAIASTYRRAIFVTLSQSRASKTSRLTS